jgi:hypothetical protein
VPLGSPDLLGSQEEQAANLVSGVPMSEGPKRDFECVLVAHTASYHGRRMTI